ncbi:MAG: hypothetical protein A3B30_04320 [Candidatus Komeilibacteria bacterium RIFCSPLOWO2_01_FULL_52_15]|uniref:Glycosyltransferase subfamily 4-like N-terminal domain-containing protein n=2 Tax=Candidatus Komeiliibacteriota TaxID=1817908 RepID=A0A1G2BPT2_9BACT|nr:MAG: hypothetical protein A2677_04080 [Candidatus Komeilibacteria bacterium RIFCSPHIGHO2_01_FULL_52_14]OGY91108.1 MAG: hypothetical protein A3B30_04320 [Candidatus Komeilibacteria bacterium RIFCSPLOWO2_01_FULL_52_15]
MSEHVEGKKIAFLITQSKFGGAQHYVLSLARYFKERNEVVVLVGEAKHQDEFFFKEAAALGIRVIVLDNLIRGISLVKAYDAVLEIRRLLAKERFDILHLNSSMGGALGSCAAWLLGFDPLAKRVRVLYTVHGFVFNEPLAPVRKKVYELIEKFSAGWKGAIITVSEFDRQAGIRHKIAPPARMVTIHNGIDQQAGGLTRQEARSFFHLPDDAFVVGLTASFYPTKNIPLLIDVIADAKRTIPAIRLVLIGNGPERQTITDTIAKHGIDAVVTMVESVPEWYRYAAAFDAVALPSVKEGFSYALLETGRAGVPIIATNVGGTPELIVHGVDGLLVQSGDRVGLTAALVEVAKKPQEARNRARHLQQRIAREFSRDEMLKKTEAIYLRLLTAGKPAASA